MDEEITDIQLQLQQFVSKWEQMKPYLTMDHLVLNIDDQSPEELLQQVIRHMESKCYSWATSESPIFSFISNDCLFVSPKRKA